MIDKIVKGIHHAEKIFIIFVFTIMTVVTFVAAINRFTAHIAMPWSEELVKYLLVWMTIIGSALGVSTGVHVGIDSLVNLLPEKVRLMVSRSMMIVGAAFSGLFTYIGIELVMKQYVQTSTALNISMGYVYGSIAVGGFLMFIEFVYLFYSSFKRKIEQEEVVIA
jgi:C4-dicarboxylate transporter DctQ subunit